MENQTPINTILDVIEKDISLNEEEKSRYIGIINSVSNGKGVEDEAFDSITSYLDGYILQEEEKALLEENVEEIDKLTDLRNAQNQLKQVLFQLKGSQQ